MPWWLGIWDCQQHKLPAIWTSGTREIHIIKTSSWKQGPVKTFLSFKVLLNDLFWPKAHVVPPMKSANFFNAFVSMDSAPRFTSTSCPHRSSPDLSPVLIGSPDNHVSLSCTASWTLSVGSSHPCKVMLLWDAAISPSISPGNATF